MPHYSISGKKEEVIPFETVRRKVAEARLTLSEEGYFWLIYYSGCRKSEGYERVAEDFEITDTHLIIDFHQRKKGGAEVPPLEFPLYWEGIDKIVRCVQLAEMKPPTYKKVFTYETTGKTRVTEKGRVVPVKRRVGRVVQARWVFPIQSTRAWKVVCKVLGRGWYPHFLRLNRLTEIGTRPAGNITEMKSFSGIKSVRSLEAYMGVSKKAQKKALDWMDHEFGKSERAKAQ